MRGFVVRFAALGLILATVGCYTSTSSPTVYGIDLRVAPGFEMESGEVSVHPTLGYAFSVAGGPTGESDGVLHLGLQLRKVDALFASAPTGFWYGGEVTYARRSTSFDPIGTITLPNATTNGFTVGGMAGFPVSEGDWGTAHAYAVVGVNKYGGWGPYTRLSIDIQPAFLRR